MADDDKKNPIETGTERMRKFFEDFYAEITKPAPEVKPQAPAAEEYKVDYDTAYEKAVGTITGLNRNGISEGDFNELKTVEPHEKLGSEYDIIASHHEVERIGIPPSDKRYFHHIKVLGVIKDIQDEMRSKTPDLDAITELNKALIKELNHDERKEKRELKKERKELKELEEAPLLRPHPRYDLIEDSLPDVTLAASRFVKERTGQDAKLGHSNERNENPSHGLTVAQAAKTNPDKTR